MALNPNRVEQIYDRLPQLVVALDPDPAGRGPAYLQDLISKVRGFLNEVSVYIQEILRVKNGLESELDTLNSSFEIASNELMATDARVSNLPAVQDRLAMINVILRTEYQAILDKRREVNEISYVEKAVRHRHRELEQTMSAIRLQRSLLQTDLKTGAFYGDENISSRGDKWQGASDIESDDIGKLLAEAEAEVEAELGKPGKPLPSRASSKPKPISQAIEDADLLDLLGYDVDVSPEDTLFCSVCGEPQKQTASGLVCSNGHGGAPSTETPLKEEEAPKAAPKEVPKATPKESPKDTEKEDPDVAAFLDDADEFADIFDALDMG